jgi:hypothetical protein
LASISTAGNSELKTGNCGNWKLETERELETGNWKLETERELETGNWKLETGNWK